MQVQATLRPDTVYEHQERTNQKPKTQSLILYYVYLSDWINRFTGMNDYHYRQRGLQSEKELRSLCTAAPS